MKKQVAADAARLEDLSAKEKELDEKVTKIMMTIPNIIDPSVPIGRMTVKMWRFRNTASRLFRILRFPIIQRLWKDFMAS